MARPTCRYTHSICRLEELGDEHVSSQALYDIPQALLRNYGYFARRVDVGDDDDPAIQIIGDTERAVMSISVSTDRLDWVIKWHRKNLSQCHSTQHCQRSRKRLSRN